MWTVTIKKGYTDVNFEFEDREEAIDFVSLASVRVKTEEVEVFLKYKKGNEE